MKLELQNAKLRLCLGDNFICISPPPLPYRHTDFVPFFLFFLEVQGWDRMGNKLPEHPSSNPRKLNPTKVGIEGR